jgi:Cu/Ag efflux pump CusA
MIEKVIEASAKNKFLIFLMVLFLSAGGIWALKNTPLDAVPDLSDVQVIVYTTWMGRNPTIMEDQVTYPIVSAMIRRRRSSSCAAFPTPISCVHHLRRWHGHLLGEKPRP